VVNGLKLLIFVGALVVTSLSAAQPEQQMRSSRAQTAKVAICEFRLTDFSDSGQFTEDSDEPPPVMPFIYYKIALNRAIDPKTVSIAFYCADSGSDPVQVCRNMIGVDRTPGGWRAWNNLLETKPQKTEMVKVAELQSVNGSGAVRLQNHTYTFQGVPYFHRDLGFCLTSPHGVTLYGGGSVDDLYGVHKSAEPEVMQLLRSIEFIDTPDDGARTAPAAASSSATSSPQ
jgi:hypothetical protein